MRPNDIYHHYKNKPYTFVGIAQPRSLLENASNAKWIASVRHHENTHSLELYEDNGLLFIEASDPFVIYRSKDQNGATLTWAREIDDFFGTVTLDDGSTVRRFARKEPDRIQVMLDRIAKMEQTGEIENLVDVIVTQNAITYNASNQDGDFITHLEVQFDNNRPNNRVLKCLPEDTAFDEVTWSEVENQKIRDRLLQEAGMLHSKLYSVTKHQPNS